MEAEYPPHRGFVRQFYNVDNVEIDFDFAEIDFDVLDS